MTLDPEALGDAVIRRDRTRVRELLRDLTEADRRAAAKALRNLLKEPEVPLLEPVAGSGIAEGIAFVFGQMARSRAGIPEGRRAAERAYDKWRAMSADPAFVAAAIGLAGGIRQAVRVLEDYHGNGWEFPADGYDLIAGVLADRNPKWLGDLISRRLSVQFELGISAWPLARRLVRLGVIGRPDIPEYTTQLPDAITDGAGRRMPVLSALLSDAGLLDDEVWRLFTVPGAAVALQWPEGEWSDALAALAGRGLLDRGRLLNACLDAFLRDFPANQVGWYLECHDRLAPTLDEIAERSGRYLALLAAASTAGVTLGQRACGKLLDAGRLDAAAFAAASAPALVFPRKSVAIAQLRLLGKIAARCSAGGNPAAQDRAARDRALVAAAEAFGHVREDVQQAALKLIARHGVPADPAARSRDRH